MSDHRSYLTFLLQWLSLWLKRCFSSLWKAVSTAMPWMTAGGTRNRAFPGGGHEEWKTDKAHHTYLHGDGSHNMVTIQTSAHVFHVNLCTVPTVNIRQTMAFHESSIHTYMLWSLSMCKVDLGRLAACSDYFRALSESSMRETSENLIHLDNLPSSVLHNLLEFTFRNKFTVPQDELAIHIQVGSYLLAENFLSRCLSALDSVLTPDTCLFYLDLAQDICCTELRTTVFTYLSRNLLELPNLTRREDLQERAELICLRSHGDLQLCSLRKENLTSWNDPETEAARHIFKFEGSEVNGEWRPIAKLPFLADKWCFTTVVLYNYLFFIGGYRQRLKRGWEFKMASYRYNPFTNTWHSTAPLIKHRRHFSAVACDGCIYAVGGWYLDSLVSPDSSTTLYTAVECYNPWEDTWRFVSSLPMTDFLFSMSLSHDVPLASSLGHFLYVLGNIQRTGEKLILQYNTRQDSWCELLPTLTRADADIPSMYFLGATDKLFVIGGNNSENVVASFSVESQQWGKVQVAEKVALAGQAEVQGNQVYMPGIEHNAIVRLDLNTLSLSVLPPLPITTNYEAVFHLRF